MAHGDKINPRMLLVSGLDLSVTKDELENGSSRPRGESYVSFAQPQQADKAIAQLDHSMLKGKLIHVAKSDFSFNKVAVELSDDIEDHKSNEELTKMFSHFGPIIRTQQFAHQPGERYLFLTFEDHQGAARAATALDNCKFLDHLMALSYIALVDPEEEDKAHREKFLAWTEMVSGIQGKCASSQMPLVDEHYHLV
ncbi:hypothetical protein OROHE_002914 [Orobanche hederae]